MTKFCHKTHAPKKGKCSLNCKRYRDDNPSKEELAGALEQAIKAVQTFETLRGPFPPAYALRDKFLKIARHEIQQDKSRRARL